MQSENKINTQATLIGFLLIALIAGITISRPYFSKKKDVSIKNTDTQENTDTDKSSTNDPAQLSSEELLKKITSGEKMIVIDLRDKSEFELEHIIDSKNITLREITSQEALSNKNIPYILIGDGTQENLILARETLLKKGASSVLYLKDSFQEWKAKNNPTISLGNPESFVDKAKTKYIKSDEFNSFIATDSNLLIIDLRSKENYTIEHIKGAINIPLAELEARRKELPIGKNIVLYDKDGLWAFQGAVKLFDLGFFNVLFLSDGFDAWKTKNYSIEK
jgi:rhodanese-related sulfurtransferase